MIVVLILILLFFVEYYFEQKTELLMTGGGDRGEIIKTIKKNSFRSIVITDDNGRLGNQLSAYASLMYFQEVHHLQPMLGVWQMDRLGQVFLQSRLEIPLMKIEVPPTSWDCVATQTPEGAYFPNPEFLQNIEDYKYNRFINIGAYPNYLYLYKTILPTLRTQLVFKPQISSLVSSWLDNIRQNDRTGLDIIFVGVHCRRTDYAAQLMQASNATLVDHHFFDTAFHMYRSWYNNATARVIFLVATDDIVWTKDNLSKHKDVMFANDFSHGRVPVSNLAGFDMCMLSFCTHSVHTYGTFGQWGSLLAGGKVVTAMGTNYKANSEEDQVNRMAAMQGWVFLDVRNRNNITVGDILSAA